jgi:formylmethanofuran dehydrogenase subunit B
LVRARYGAFFHGPALGACGAATVQEAIALVRDRNEPARFVALALGGPGNPSGAEAVLTWQAGAPLAVDFARGVPRFLPSEAGAHARLVRGEADAALVVGPVPDRLPPAAIAHLESIPRVVIAPDATVPPVQATVALASARAGIEAGGTVLRCDGVTLPLRPALAMSRPADQDHLAALLDALTRSET